MMTDDEINAYINRPEFAVYIESDSVQALCAEFDRALDAGKLFSMEETAEFFGMPFEIFRIVFADFLARAEMTSEPGSRH
jgi:hypothetical protein